MPFRLNPSLLMRFFGLTGLFFLLNRAVPAAASAQLPMPELAVYQARLSARVNQYDPERFNSLAASARTSLDASGNSLTFQGSTWQVDREVKALPQKGQYELTVTFRCLSGEVPNGSVSVDLAFDNWSTQHYVLMPGSVYNGNRYPYVQMDYAPFFITKDQMGLDKPLVMSDGPRLNYRAGLSRLQDRSGSMAFPSVGFQSPGSAKGFWLCTQQGNQYGDYGMDVEENASRSRATFTLTAPVVREVQRHWLARMDVKPSTDAPVHFKAGDVSTLTFFVDFFDCPTVQGLYDELTAIRTERYPSPAKPKLMPYSAVYKMVENVLNTRHWRGSYYGTGLEANRRGGDWQPGWVGGMITVFALLAEGSPETRQRVVQNTDWVFPNALSPSGYYYDLRHEGKFVSAKDIRAFGNDLTLVRKNADATLYAFKEFDLMAKLGMPVKEEWKQGNLRAVDAQLATFRTYGQLGHYVNQQTGELVVGNTTSAGLFPASLLAAYRLTNRQEYRQAAEAIASHYYEQFVAKGLTSGGPSDAMQSFDSESSYGLLESFVELHEVTQDPLWLRRSEEMARQFATWVVAYDYRFPPNTTFGKLDMRTTGLVLANTQNKTAAPGICTHSGLGLLKLYRATQNPFYLRLLADIAHTMPQFMSTRDRPLPKYEEGWIFERGGMTDWLEGIGETSAHNAWPSTTLLLNYAELPGVYVNLTTDQVFELDHVGALLTSGKKGAKTLTLTNPTRYDAEVKVLAETRPQATQPLGMNAFLRFERVWVPAGKSVAVPLNPSR